MDSVSDSASEATFMVFGLVAIIYAVFYLAILVPTLALSVRRLRDAGFHWAFIFFELIPLLAILSGFIFLPVLSLEGVTLLILLAMPSKEVSG